MAALKGVWLVKHPCPDSTKKEARAAGCRIVDLRYKSGIDPDLVRKTIDGKKKRKPKPKEAVNEEGV